MAVKRVRKIAVLSVGLLIGGAAPAASAQSYELQRLILDIQKLNELKAVLANLYKGYKVLETGYTTIKGISEGSFTLHEAFLDGLWLVSPAVRQYPAAQRIIDNQVSIVTETNASRNRFRSSDRLRAEELVYVAGVYDHLIDQSGKNVTQLLRILSPRTLRMSDAERLRAIDELDRASNEQLLFLRRFHNSTVLLVANRTAGNDDARTLQQLYGLP